MSTRNHLFANGLLVLAVSLWGASFVFQKTANAVIDPLWFTSIRFALAALTLSPLVFLERRKNSGMPKIKELQVGILLGSFMFMGSIMQQIGLQYTSVANSGFITGFYVVLVPILGFVLGQRHGLGIWIGGGLALSGLYLLSVPTTGFVVNYGDMLTLGSACFWTCHVFALSGIAKTIPPMRSAFIQFCTCSVLALITCWILSSPISYTHIQLAQWEILYSGILAIGVGFTAQVIAQQHVLAVHAAIILSLEAVTAAIAGWLMLSETLSVRSLLGCVLVLAGCLVSQLAPYFRRELRKKALHHAAQN